MSRVKVGLIGAGRAGMIHARTLSRHVDDAEVVAVADPDAQAAASAGESLGTSRTFTDYHQLLAEPGLDAVVVVTPTKFHRDIVVEAATAGLHVLCEKPMAMTADECTDMNVAAASAGIVLQIGFMRRFDAGFQRAKHLIDEGRIGDVVMVKSMTHGPSVPQPWMYDISVSNGPLAEVSSHDIDTVRWLCGAEMTSVHALAGNYRCPQAREPWPDFYDSVLMTSTMSNGTIGLVDGAQGVTYGYDARAEVLGTHGRIDVGDLRDNRVVLHERTRSSSTDIVPSWRTLFEDAYVAEDKAFISAVRGESEPQVTGLDGLRAVEIVAAGNESIRTGRVVNLDHVH